VGDGAEDAYEDALAEASEATVRVTAAMYRWDLALKALGAATHARNEARHGQR